MTTPYYITTRPFASLRKALAVAAALFILPALTAPGALPAQNRSGLSPTAEGALSEVLALVEQNNPELKALRLSNEAAKLEVRSTNNFSQDISISYSPFFQSGVDGVASSEMVVSTGFDFPSLYFSRGKAVSSKTEALDREYSALRRDILLEAKQVCLDLIRLETEREFIELRLANGDSLLASASRSFEAGATSLLELNKVKLEQMRLKTRAAENKAAQNALLESLSAYCGGEKVDFSLSAYPADQLPLDFDLFYEELRAQDAELLSAKASQLAALQEVKTSKQAWLPSFEVGYRRNTALSDAAHGFLVGASLPIFSTRFTTKTAQARADAAAQELLATELRLEAEYRAKFAEVSELASIIYTYDIAFLESSLDALNRAVMEGQISILDFYQEANIVYDAISEYRTLENSYYKALAELYKNYL